MKKIYMLFIFNAFWMYLVAQGVGINTNNPQATLHVAGDLRIDSFAVSPYADWFLVIDPLTGKVASRQANFSSVTTSWACGDVLIDQRDGQSYRTVLMGSQCWMADNLNYKTPWSFYYAGDSVSYASHYGRLYTWYDAMDNQPASSSVPSGVQGACPVGWHVPSHMEWAIMVFFHLGSGAQGGHLKETNSLYWNAPNTNATNYARFNARGGGNCNGGAHKCTSMKIHSEWWLSSTGSAGQQSAVSWQLKYNSPNVSDLNNNKNSNLYLRCVKD